MSIILGDHPDIVWAERTGYPEWNQPENYVCDKCGDEIDDSDEVYSNSEYDYLCQDCLCTLYRKWW